MLASACPENSQYGPVMNRWFLFNKQSIIQYLFYTQQSMLNNTAIGHQWTGVHHYHFLAIESFTICSSFVNNPSTIKSSITKIAMNHISPPHITTPWRPPTVRGHGAGVLVEAQQIAEPVHRRGRQRSLQQPTWGARPVRGSARQVPGQRAEWCWWKHWYINWLWFASFNDKMFSDLQMRKMIWYWWSMSMIHDIDAPVSFNEQMIDDGRWSWMIIMDII